MELPLAYRWLKAHGFDGLVPWHFIDPEQSHALRRAYQRETGNRFIPFAKRQDNDDIAGFEVQDGRAQNSVVTVHLTWTGNREPPGWPRIVKSADIFDWLAKVVYPATRAWMTEAELEDLINNQNLRI